MSNLTLYLSNRMETLVEQLAQTIREQPLANIFGREIIIVHSKGMQRWIALKLAEINGVCANVEFPFPNAFVDDCFRKIFTDLPKERTPYDPAVMTWRIMRLFDPFREHPAFESIRYYLDEDPSGLKRFQLASRIADLFDQYIIYRPQWIKAWNSGDGDHFQALLWRAMMDENSAKTPVVKDRATILDAFIKQAPCIDASDAPFPERVSLFGISSLPWFHMRVFEAIARFSQVNLFLMNPCREYWGDIPTNWEIKRISSRYGDLTLEQLHVEQGNRLLASMGAMGRDFFDMIWEKGWGEQTQYHDPAARADARTPLLHHIQSGVLNLTEGGSAPGEPAASPRIHIRADDDSIRISACHGPMREIECLYNYLLDRFDRDPSLTPDQVIVMAPDIETYAPFIQAVFDAPETANLRIPYSIADRSSKSESSVIRTYLDILGVAGSRCNASEVIEILRSEEVMQRMGVSLADFENITALTRATMIRWGRGKEHRKHLGLPPEPQNTWEEGLNRMFLGFALPTDDLFEGRLPFDAIESSQALALGKLAEFTRRLFHFGSMLEKKRPLSQWSDLLRMVLNAFFPAGPDEEFQAGEEARNEMRVINEVLQTLKDLAEQADYEETVDIAVIRHYLKQAFETKGFGSGFITGGVTFCAMLPMRSIPFEIVCLVGMNHDAFPRRSKPVGFDLMARHPQKGDRSRRDDDRYLFLEALLSARRNLYISYVGQSIKDNSASPPSVLVDELLDQIRSGYKFENGSVEDALITLHRLQAFNPDYFQAVENSSPSGLFSFSKHHCQVAQGVVRPRQANPEPFISKALPHPDDNWRCVALADFKAFFKNPAKHLLEKRLGLYLQNREAVIEDKEPFDLDSLERYKLKQELVQTRVNGDEKRQPYEHVSAQGRLPHGRIGRIVYDELAGQADGFVERIRGYIAPDALEPLDIHIAIGNFEMQGQVHGFYPKRRIQHRPATVKAKDHLDFWLDHLAVNCIAPQGRPLNGVLIGEDAIWRYARVDQSRKILSDLLNIYWKGLTRPLHFFPQSALAFAHQINNAQKEPRLALGAAYGAWLSGYKYTGEYDQSPYFQRCFPDGDAALNHEFETWALAVYTPLLECIEEVKS